MIFDDVAHELLIPDGVLPPEPPPPDEPEVERIRPRSDLDATGAPVR